MRYFLMDSSASEKEVESETHQPAKVDLAEVAVSVMLRARGASCIAVYRKLQYKEKTTIDVVNNKIRYCFE